MFEKLRETIEAILAAATPAGDARDVVARMHDAVIEARTSLMEMSDQLSDIERRLEKELQKLEDAERRGKLADGIGDRETVEVAEEFAAKHRERAAVLTRKLDAQRAELALAEREFGQMREQFKKARNQRGLEGDASDRIESAWRNIESAGGTRPELDLKVPALDVPATLPIEDGLLTIFEKLTGGIEKCLRNTTANTPTS